MAEEKSNNELAIGGDRGFVTIERSMMAIDVVNDREKALELFKIMSKGNMSKDKSPEDLMAMYVKSRELGIGFASAADHMHVVNGKTGVDIHIIKALLLKAGSGIHWEKLKDYEPQYKYTDESNNVWVKDSDPNKFLPPECMYVYDKTTTEKCKAEGKVAVWKVGHAPVDWVTTYKFTREVKARYGDSVKILSEIGTFSWLEAISAQLPTNKEGQLDPKSNWQKYRKLMIDTRAFTFGARAIGADLLMGVYETKELFDMNSVSYTVEPNSGEVIEVK